MGWLEPPEGLGVKSSQAFSVSGAGPGYSLFATRSVGRFESQQSELELAAPPITLALIHISAIGIPLGVGVIIFTIILTNIYVRRANTEFDELNAEIIKEANRK